MTNYIKVNGEWVKNRIYAIVDAAHTRFSSTKFTATNVSDALDEIADSIGDVESALADLIGGNDE